MYLIIGTTFLVCTCIAFLILWYIGRRSDPAFQRLKEASEAAGSPKRGGAVGGGQRGETTKKPPRLERIASTLSRIAHRDGNYDSNLRLEMMQAGLYRENSARIYVGARILGATLLFLLGAFLGLIGRGITPSTILYGVLLAYVGYMIPQFLLRSKIRRRREAIASNLADALDFLVICVEAGLGLNAALVRVGRELQTKNGVLGEELLLVNQEMRAGVTREEALRHLCRRNVIEDLKILVGSLILADKLGTNITATLRAQSDSLRTRVRQRAEERAARAGIWMLLPLIFLILPALFIVILGPGVILVIQSLAPLAQ